MRTILWYDLETFGLNPRYDRIAQAAAIRTDMDLNPIGEPIVLYAKLSQDYLPTPSSCLITGITPQEVNEKGICEAEFIKDMIAQKLQIECDQSPREFCEQYYKEEQEIKQ